MKSSNYKNKNLETKYLNTWYDWLINYILDPIGKIIVGFKGKVINFFKTSTPQ